MCTLQNDVYRWTDGCCSCSSQVHCLTPDVLYCLVCDECRYRVRLIYVSKNKSVTDSAAAFFVLHFFFQYNIFFFSSSHQKNVLYGVRVFFRCFFFCVCISFVCRDHYNINLRCCAFWLLFFLIYWLNEMHAMYLYYIIYIFCTQHMRMNWCAASGRMI